MPASASPAVHNSSAENEAPSTDMIGEIAELKASTRLLQHAPRRHHHRIASELDGTITAAFEQRSPYTCWRLHFIHRSPLAVPADPLSSGETVTRIDPGAPTATNEAAFSRRVKRKYRDEDIRAALRILSTSDSVVSPSEEVVAVLRAKHSQQHTMKPFQGSLNSTNPASHRRELTYWQPSSLCPLARCRLYRCAVSAPMPARGRVHPRSRPETAHLSLDIPEDTRQAFFSANLVAIKKKDGGVSPTAVASIYRRLGSKVLPRRMSSTLAKELQAIQMGCEAVVHGVRKYVDANNGTPNYIIAKLDLAIHGSAVLREVISRFLGAVPLVSQSYSHPSLKCTLKSPVLSRQRHLY